MNEHAPRATTPGELAGPAAVVGVQEFHLVFVAWAVGLVAKREGQPDLFEFAPSEVAFDGFWFDAVDAGAVEPENLRLDLWCERRVAVALLEFTADVEGAEGLD